MLAGGAESLDTLNTRRIMVAPSRRVVSFSWVVLATALITILWGAVVRATGSGAGCGDHWPLCNGEMIPLSPSWHTIVEGTHRLSSGLLGIFVLILVWLSYRETPPRSVARFGALLSLIFTGTEGFIGREIVKLKLVVGDASVLRTEVIAMHLVNTNLLVATLVATVWAMHHPDQTLSWARRGRAWLLFLAALSLLAVSAAGAVTALGDTLFRPDNLAEGIARDFSEHSHFLERLRVIHPIVAIMVGLFLFFLGLLLSPPSKEATNLAPRVGRVMALTVGAQLMLGFVNMGLRAPTLLQVTHLLVANFLWMTLVLFSLELLAVPARAIPRSRQIKEKAIPVDA